MHLSILLIALWCLSGNSVSCQDTTSAPSVVKSSQPDPATTTGTSDTEISNVIQPGNGYSWGRDLLGLDPAVTNNINIKNLTINIGKLSVNLKNQIHDGMELHDCKPSYSPIGNGNQIQNRIMNDFCLCNQYWVHGFGAEEMIAQAVEPLAVTKLVGEWAQGPFHTAWVSGSQEQTNREVDLLSNLFPGNIFTPTLGPFPEPNVSYCGRLTNNPVSINLNTLAFQGGFGFFELSTVDLNGPINAYTSVVKANHGNIIAFYESVATTTNCTELIAAYSLTGTPVVSMLPDAGSANSLFIRTATKRFEVVCGLPSLPDPCAGRNYGSCATNNSLLAASTGSSSP